MPEDRQLHILNLGAGVQSTTLYLMSMAGEVQPFDVAIFADTQEEPEAVYAHLAWLGSLGGPRILTVSAGRLGNDLIAGKNSTGANLTRFTSIPTFCTDDGGQTHGRNRRQCSSEYKTEPIEKGIRREVLGLLPGRTIPKGVRVHQYFGISLDEASRATRIYERFHVTEESKLQPHFPLIDRMMTRANCIEWLAGRVPHEVPRSACVFCPFHSDAEWQRLKDTGGIDWSRALEIDEALRSHARAAQYMNKTMYLHRSCQPLVEIDFKPQVNRKELQLGFGVECEGVCGV